MHDDEIERCRDIAEQLLKESIRRKALLSSTDYVDEIIGTSVYTKGDLGIEDYQIAESDRHGDALQKVINRHTTKKPNPRSKLAATFLQKTAGLSYLQYAVLRKKLGFTIESPVLRYWNMPYHRQIMTLVNPGGLIQVREGSYTIDTNILLIDDLQFSGVGFATKLVGSASLGNTAIIGEPTGSLDGSILSNMEIDGSNMNISGYHTGRKGVDIHTLDHSFFDKLYIHNTPASGLGIDYLSQCSVSNIYAFTCGTTGQQAGSNGIGIGTGAGTNEPLAIFGCHARSCKNAGILVESQGNSSRDTVVTACTSRLNVQGFNISGVSRLSMSACDIADNTNHGLRVRHSLDPTTIKSFRVAITGCQFISNTLDGISFDSDSDVTLWSIEGSTITNNLRYGVNLAGIITDLLIQGNIIKSNSSGNINDGSDVTSTGIVIKDNPGYNPVGLSAITVGGNPFTYPAGKSPETIYIYGGTVSGITKSGTTIATASPTIVNMEPNTSITITYSATPTMVKNIH